MRRIAAPDVPRARDVAEVVGGDFPHPGLDIVFQVGERRHDGVERCLAPKDLQVPRRRQLDAVEMRQDAGGLVARPQPKRRSTIGLRQIPLRDDARVEIGRQSRSPRSSRMMRLGAVPPPADRPRRFMRAAESGHATDPCFARAGTMRATTRPRLVTAISWPRATMASTAAKSCCTSRTDAVFMSYTMSNMGERVKPHATPQPNESEVWPPNVAPHRG